MPHLTDAAFYTCLWRLFFTLCCPTLLCHFIYVCLLGISQLLRDVCKNSPTVITCFSCQFLIYRFWYIQIIRPLRIRVDSIFPFAGVGDWCIKPPITIMQPVCLLALFLLKFFTSYLYFYIIFGYSTQNIFFYPLTLNLLESYLLSVRFIFFLQSEIILV